MSDSDLTLLRDQLYPLAQAAIALTPGCRSKRPFTDALQYIPTNDVEEIEERAAIVEFDGKLPREFAERLALVPRIRSNL